jgi:hypothetical protein
VTPPRGADESERRSPMPGSRDEPGGGTPDDAATAAGQPTERPTAAPGSPLCDLCGAPMRESHCKLVCDQCGYTRDCSDP